MMEMCMKKIAPLALSALLLGTVAVGAEQSTTMEGTEETVKQSSFVRVTGEIDAVEKLDGRKLFMIEDEQNPFQFYVDDKTLVYDNQGEEVELKVGDTVSIYVYANQPMILIYPPRYSPAVVIVELLSTMTTTLKVTQFDENYLSEDGQLKLNLQDKSVIINAKGEKVAPKDLKNYSALVFYGPTTKSIPPQTSPYKIVVFPKLEDGIVDEPSTEIAPEISAIIGSDYKKVDGKVMVPIRVIAEKLGYKVKSTGKGAVISKGALSYTITRGEKMYGHNKASRYFKVAPTLLENNKTYVEYDFVLQLLK